MDKYKKNIVGVYEIEQNAILAIGNLVKQGYTTKEICVIGQNVKKVTEERDAIVEDTSARGAVLGETLGGVIGLLAGIGTLTIPGIGPIVAAGPIATSLLGALSGGGLEELYDALIGLGIPKEEAKYYWNSVKEGKILILAKKKEYCPNEMEQVTPQEMNSILIESFVY
jgi:hypothetical protein